MGKNRSAGVFSFFQLEETGDSEVVLGGGDPGKHAIPVVDDEDGNKNDKKDIDQDDDDDDDDYDDDAGSCCYDSSYSSGNNSRHDAEEFDEEERDCDDAESEDAATHEINVEKHPIPFRHETWESEHYSDTASTTDLSGYFKKPSCIISVDTAKEPLTEAEKSRRFWEACLAS